jgi:S1-C subfamily serine protease
MGLLVSIIVLFSVPRVGHADPQLKTLQTAEGLLAVLPGKGSDCYSCEGLFLNGKQLLHNQYVFINGVFPSIKDPKLISVSSDGGGNCCPPTYYLLDFSRRPHLTVEGAGFNDYIARTQNGVLFTQFADSNDLGDRQVGLYEYNWGAGQVALKKVIPQFNHTPLTQKLSTDDFLSDPDLRGPLLIALGNKEFANFRNFTTVSGPDEFKLVGGLVVGSGCVPHNCNGQFGLFVLDENKKAGWAVEGFSDVDGKKHATIWGILTKNDGRVLQVIVDWLARNEIPSSSVVFATLTDQAKQIYGDQTAKQPTQFNRVGLDATGQVKVDFVNAQKSAPVSSVELFKVLAPSIYVVTAQKESGETLQGSAVAVSEDVLLTNCHVVADSSSISMNQNDNRFDVDLVSANLEADRCVLKSKRKLNNYVTIRSYDELKIGERVYSIGAPSGLELTLSDGLLSGKRNMDGRRLIQTTAPISPGSSGGGLFDESGNLIGITTFFLKDTENLNFAIAAIDYVRR